MQKSIKKSIAKGPNTIQRKSLDASRQDWVRTRKFDGDQAIPLVIEPAVDGVDLVDWAKINRSHVDELLSEHRALLFRGFSVDSVGTFQDFVMAASNGQLLEYRDRSTPRTTKGNRIYTSTVHPQDQRINPHNEGTYWTKWALKIFFCSLKLPTRGGQTPIADVRKVHDRIDASIRQTFLDKQWMLVRNYNDGFGLPWQEVFQTDDEAEVEQYCRDNDIHFEWKNGGRLRTQQVRPAIRKHPVSSEPLWFNHAAFFHYTTLDATTRDALLNEFGVDGLPYNTCYGDGSPIETEVAEHLRQAYAAETRMFDWHAGDVMMLDNMTISHAREPYVGDREVVVSMTDVVDGSKA
jgi:alpha-ketoglutarate-dependent taurine dioxygenase